MEDAPQNLKTAAIVQIVSGLLNFAIMPAAWFIGGQVCGTVGLAVMCPVGYLCGFAGCLLVPIGIFEMVSGIMGLTNPRQAGTVMRIASFVEMGSLLAGGIPSAVAGGVVFTLLRDDEVVAWLEGGDAPGAAEPA